MFGPYSIFTRAFVLALLWGGVPEAWAHGFGQRYDLPVPLWLYVTGAAATVALSFVVLGAWMRHTPNLHSYPRYNLLHSRFGRLLAHPLLLMALRVVAVYLYVVLIIAGLFGTLNPTRNIVPTLIWVIWWVGLAYVSALFGNLWAVINPLSTIYEWVEALYKRLRAGQSLSRLWRYPPGLGVWPGVGLFLLFAWIELVYDNSDVPSHLAGFTLLYSALTWIGMFLFGKDAWLRQGETFSLVFGLLARFSPTEVRVLDPAVCQECHSACLDLNGECIDCYACFHRAPATQRQWNLRPWAIGLVRQERISVSQMAFVLLLLATVTFDGFMATPIWVDIERTLLTAPPPLGGGNMTMVRTLGLLLFPVLFLELYLIFSFLMTMLSDQRLSTARLAQAFPFSLVPIAIAYHMAHYFSFLLVHGQRLIPLLSDPLGIGWDMWGTAAYRVDIGLVGARFAWYSAVIAIVLGHVIAVYLAHLIAMRLWCNRAVAIRSQYPMLVLMVAYTVISLWILAQPIVEGGEHAADTPATAPRAELTVSPTVTLAAFPTEAPQPTSLVVEMVIQATPAAVASTPARNLLYTLPGLPRNESDTQDFTVRTSVLCYCLEKGPELIRTLRRFSGDWYEKGLAALQHQEHGTAVIAFSQALHRAPRDGRAYYNRSLAYARQGIYPQAIADISRALDLLPEQAEVAYLHQLITLLVEPVSQSSQEPQPVTQVGDATPTRLPLGYAGQAVHVSQ